MIDDYAVFLNSEGEIYKLIAKKLASFKKNKTAIHANLKSII